MASVRDLGLVLKVVILRARDLAAKDRNGFSDPYLVLNLGDSKVTTHSVPKTLNPEWNVIESLPINSVQSLLLEVICWDKDRFGKDYLGEFDVALEELFEIRAALEPRWFALKSKRSNKKPGKKSGAVSGEVLLQFTLLDSTNPSATHPQVLEKFAQLIAALPAPTPRNGSPNTTPLVTPTRPSRPTPPSPPAGSADGTGESTDPDDLDLDLDDEDYEDEDSGKPGAMERRRSRKLRVKGLRRKKRMNPFEFAHGASDVVGIIYLEICNITDLPPESNLIRTGFDMDPFVVASLGKKTYRTRHVRHNLNPVFNEKMLFQVLNHEQAYSFGFAVIDRDKYSGNDFIASGNLPVKYLIDKAPKANPDTGLYELPEPPEFTKSPRPKGLLRFGLSRSASTQSIGKLIRPSLSKPASTTPTAVGGGGAEISIPTSVPGTPGLPLTPGAPPTPGFLAAYNGLLSPTASEFSVSVDGSEAPAYYDEAGFSSCSIPLKMKNADKWEAKHNPVLLLRAKYMPYSALRQQFWRSMLKQYDTDETGMISKIEITTLLDTLGSTLRESTIDGFFERFPHDSINGDGSWEITMDEAVLCLEDQLQAKSKSPTITDRLKAMVPDVKDVLAVAVPGITNPAGQTDAPPSQSQSHDPEETPPDANPATSQPLTIVVPELNTPGEEGELLERDDDLTEEQAEAEEHVIEIRECPICHLPRLNKRRDADIITHIATCASQDWRQVNTLVMGGFVTASQAQRKWYSKVITKIGYGGYKVGANSANILVQDRMTGQINEEKMSVYVRLGIRLLYKGLKSKDMENKRIRKLLKSLSIKQGKKFDDPASKDEIPKFVQFHQLDMSEVLLPAEEFKNFNEFFYRALKPGARPCSAPDNPKIIVSPADCRSVVFNHIDHATKIWVKGREFSIKRLLGGAYPEDVARFENGSLGIFRLAPQDYHRFHIPVDGVMGKPKPIDGEYYTVNPMAIRSALDVYGENVRVIVPIDSVAHGRVMVICVGAMMVGSTVITRNEGDHVRRAEELGYFKFGGSTLVVLFEEGRMRFDSDLVDNSNESLETLIRAGMSIGHSPDQPQWTPDMPKEADQVTEAEKLDAKRRIQGNLSAEASPYGSGDEMPQEKPKTPAITSLIT